MPTNHGYRTEAAKDQGTSTGVTYINTTGDAQKARMEYLQQTFPDIAVISRKDRARTWAFPLGHELLKLWVRNTRFYAWHGEQLTVNVTYSDPSEAALTLESPLPYNGCTQWDMIRRWAVNPLISQVVLSYEGVVLHTYTRGVTGHSRPRVRKRESHEQS